MSLRLSRNILRRQVLQANRQIVSRRAASTSPSDVASAAKDKLGPAASKAQEGLSRAASSAGNALGAAGRAVGNIGGPIGRLVGGVQSLVPPALYYSRVGLELCKIVFEARSMSLPPVQTFQNYFSGLLKNVRQSSQSSGSFNDLLNQARSIDRKQLTTAGIIGAEILGFFTLGEMIGRLKLVGYRSKEHDLHHHD